MKTEIDTLKLYSFDELDEKAKEKAMTEFLSHVEFPYWDEIWDTLKSVCDWLGMRLTDLRVDTDYGRFEVQPMRYPRIENDEVWDMEGNRVARWIYNNWISQLIVPKRVYSRNCMKCRKSNVFIWYRLPVSVGYYLEETIVYGAVGFLRNNWNTITIKEFIDEIFYRASDEVSRDLRYWESEKNIRDYFYDNDMLFYKNGTLYGSAHIYDRYDIRLLIEKVADVCHEMADVFVARGDYKEAGYYNEMAENLEKVIGAQIEREKHGQ